MVVSLIDYHRRGIVTVFGALIEIALKKAYALTFLNIDCGNNLHG